MNAHLRRADSRTPNLKTHFHMNFSPFQCVDNTSILVPIYMAIRPFKKIIFFPWHVNTFQIFTLQTSYRFLFLGWLWIVVLPKILSWGLFCPLSSLSMFFTSTSILSGLIVSKYVSTIQEFALPVPQTYLATDILNWFCNRVSSSIQ